MNLSNSNIKLLMSVATIFVYEIEIYFAKCFGSPEKSHRQAVRYKI